MNDVNGVAVRADIGSLLQTGPITKEVVEAIESVMLQEQQVECPVIHRFGPGVYVREVMIPAGTIAIGHHQKYEHMNVLLKGRVSIVNEDRSISELVAPMMFVGKPGRKMGFIHEDMVWLNIYPNPNGIQDVDTLEANWIEKSPVWLESVGGQVKLLQNIKDVSDYHEVLAEFGFDEITARSQSENTEDLIELPYGNYKIKVADSPIEGKGLFATAGIAAGEVIAPARIGKKRTIAGRYTNHSVTPNARMEVYGGGIALVALQDIKGCQGGSNGEEITVDYRETLRLSTPNESEV